MGPEEEGAEVEQVPPVAVGEGEGKLKADQIRDAGRPTPSALQACHSRLAASASPGPEGRQRVGGVGHPVRTCHS